MFITWKKQTIYNEKQMQDLEALEMFAWMFQPVIRLPLRRGYDLAIDGSVDKITNTNSHPNEQKRFQDNKRKSFKVVL